VHGLVGGLQPGRDRLEALEPPAKLGFEIAQLRPRQLDPQLIELGLERDLQLARFPALQIQSNVHTGNISSNDETGQGP